MQITIKTARPEILFTPELGWFAGSNAVNYSQDIPAPKPTDDPKIYRHGSLSVSCRITTSGNVVATCDDSRFPSPEPEPEPT